MLVPGAHVRQLFCREGACWEHKNRNLDNEKGSLLQPSFGNRRLLKLMLDWQDELVYIQGFLPIIPDSQG